MAAATYNIIIEQGADWSRTLFMTTATGTAVNIAGRSYSAQIRQFPSGTVATSFSVTVPSAANGQILMSLSAAASLAVPTSGAKYDLLQESSGVYTRLLEGAVTLRPRITVP